MRERYREILSFTTGKVLDIGCLQHGIHRTYSDDWLHRILSSEFDTIGIDLNEDVLKLKERGYNVYQCDAEDFNLNDKFDTIVAGEIIEHLSNPGKFLDCCKEHLKGNGKLIITTPNPWCLERFVRKLTNVFRINSEHKMWFDYTTLLQLCEFKNFELKYFNFISSPLREMSSFRGILFHRLFMKVIKRFLSSELTNTNIIFVLEVKR